MPADGTGLPIIVRGNSRAIVVGSFPLSKALDRASKLHGYRINAYVRLRSKASF
jgi:hypothetical protein